MKDFIEKSKLLADLDKYEHELSSLEMIKDFIDRKIEGAREKIEACRLLLIKSRIEKEFSEHMGEDEKDGKNT